MVTCCQINIESMSDWGTRHNLDLNARKFGYAKGDCRKIACRFYFGPNLVSRFDTPVVVCRSACMDFCLPPERTRNIGSAILSLNTFQLISHPFQSLSCRRTSQEAVALHSRHKWRSKLVFCAPVLRYSGSHAQIYPQNHYSNLEVQAHTYQEDHARILQAIMRDPIGQYYICLICAVRI